jgi:hypothetical protein
MWYVGITDDRDDDYRWALSERRVDLLDSNVCKKNSSHSGYFMKHHDGYADQRTL